MLMILLDLSGLFDPFFHFFARTSPLSAVSPLLDGGPGHLLTTVRPFARRALIPNPILLRVLSPVFLGESRTPSPESRLLASLMRSSCFFAPAVGSVLARLRFSRTVPHHEGSSCEPWPRVRDADCSLRSLTSTLLRKSPSDTLPNANSLVKQNRTGSWEDSLRLCVISRGKIGIFQPLLERRVLAELSVQFGVILQKVDDDAFERQVVLNASVLFVRVLHGVLIRPVCGHLGRDLLTDHFPDLVAVLPVDVAELLVERLKDVGKVVELRFRHPPAARGRYRTDFRVLVGQRDLHRCLHFHAVAVHVDRFQNPLREVVF